MGTFQDVTTRTMERGISTLRGCTTLRPLQAETGLMLPAEVQPAPQRTNSPAGLLLLASSSSRQHGRPFAQVTHKVVTEVEGHGVLVRLQPPEGHEAAASEARTSKGPPAEPGLDSYFCVAAFPSSGMNKVKRYGAMQVEISRQI